MNYWLMRYSISLKKERVSNHNIILIGLHTIILQQLYLINIQYILLLISFRSFLLHSHMLCLLQICQSLSSLDISFSICILDYDASHHMSANHSSFISFSPTKLLYILIVDNTHMPLIGDFSIVIFKLSLNIYCPLHQTKIRIDWILQGMWYQANLSPNALILVDIDQNDVRS